jgi:putative endonuclease
LIPSWNQGNFHNPLIKIHPKEHLSMACMYILECADGSYYVGSTTNLERRLWEHQEGIGSKYTSTRLPVKLVFAAEFESIKEAYFWEKRVQGWSRAKRQALIRGEVELLPGLAKKNFTKYRERHPKKVAKE